MSLVTATEQARALALLGSGPASRDELLLSLARQRVWTTKQRELVDTLWNDERAKRKEARMKAQAQVTTAVMMAVALLGLSGCAATYEKRFTDHDGKAVVIRESHEPDWWNTLGTPDWLNVRHETITRGDRVVADRVCTHEPTHPLLLICEPVTR